MYSASPPYHCPSTPLAPRNPLTYKPLNSSPLACSSDWSKSSPVAAAQAHRRSQYKALTPNTPTRKISNSRRSSGRLFTVGSDITTPARPDSQKLSLRDRFKARCFERAAKAREKAIKGKRYANQPGSDDFSMDYDDDDDEDDDDEDIMQDELFRRIMANATRKERHSYRISYAQEVGSSIDPDLEDVATWEQELAVSGSANNPHGTNNRPREEEEELTPIDLDDEELEAYAEECAQGAALADFDDILEEELFNWSDFEDPDEHEYDMDIA